MAELRDISRDKEVAEQLKGLANMYTLNADYLQDLEKHIHKMFIDNRLLEERYNMYMKALSAAEHYLLEAGMSLDNATADYDD